MEQIFGQQILPYGHPRKAAVTDHNPADAPSAFALLGSALAGRTIVVRGGAPGEPAWTDGLTVFLDPARSDREQLQTLAVQASLLAAGSLGPEAIRKLSRRPGLARRYLTVEGHRALAENEDLLPPAVRPLLDPDIAQRSDSPGDSLDLAIRDTDMAAPPEVFGIIRARRMVAGPSAGQPAGPTAGRDAGDNGGADPDELHEEDEDPLAQPGADPFSSPVGGGGAIGKLLARMLGTARAPGGGGPPGADSATHRGRKSSSGGSPTVSAAMTDLADDGAPGEMGAATYPEWDANHRRYRADWCTVVEMDPPEREATALPRPDAHALRRPLTRLGIGLDRRRRQALGDDIDVDAAVQSRVDTLAGRASDGAIYIESLRRRRDLAVLVLLDISGSAAEAGTGGRTVHEQQLTAAHALTFALHELGDRVALYAFQSHGRTAVHIVPVKRFGDPLDTASTHRLAVLKPGAYSRLGAAIRHGTAVMAREAGTSRRLLVVVSDGLAYDHGYERTYGAADARRALGEARRDGTGCVCLTVGAGTGAGDLRMVFGSAAHASIPNPSRLSEVIGPLFRSALRTADLRRRVS